MPLLHPRIRPLLALMQGLVRTVRGGRLARHLEGAVNLVPPSGLTPKIERLGARWGMSPGARDGRDARLRACPSRRDLSDVGSHSEPPGRARRTGSCRSYRSAQRPPKYS